MGARRGQPTHGGAERGDGWTVLGLMPPGSIKGLGAEAEQGWAAPRGLRGEGAGMAEGL